MLPAPASVPRSRHPSADRGEVSGPRPSATIAATKATAVARVTVALPVRPGSAPIDGRSMARASSSRIDDALESRGGIGYCDAVGEQIWPLCAWPLGPVLKLSGLASVTGLETERGTMNVVLRMTDQLGTWR